MLVIPAILEDNSRDIENKVNLLKEDAKYFHIDIMDKTLTTESTIRVSDIPIIENIQIELHMMVKKPSDYIKEITKAKPKKVILHSEINNFETEIAKLKGPWKIYGAVDVNTEIDIVVPYLDKIAGILIMSVPIGKTGQKFHKEVLKKALYISKYTNNIEIDGGVNLRNISSCIRANIGEFAISSGIYKGENPVKNLQLLKQKLFTRV